MGRGDYYRYNKKALTTDLLALDMRRFTSEVSLSEGRMGSWQWTRGEHKSSIIYIVEPGQGVRLQYTHNKTEQLDYLVRVVTTTPNYGGVRYWWICPNRHCGRRCRILYGGKYFCCRQCHQLTYASAQSGERLEAIDSRLTWLGRRLKGTGADWRHVPDKPRFMHWTTYSSLMAEYISLLRLRDRTWLRGALALTGPFENSPPIEPAEAIQASWHAIKRLRYTEDLTRYAMADWTYTPAVDLMASAENNRLTLGELATRAGVPFAFAQEAVAEGLFSADQGRTKRRKRYRRRLSAWLRKLYALRQAGLSWADIRAWTRRRFQPGHEHERLWPDGNLQNP